MLLILVGWLFLCKEIVLDKKYVFDFFGFFNNIYYECYEEGCVFIEVVEYYGYLEKLVSLWYG